LKVVELPVLNKPDFGSPCNGCGYCCINEVCKVGLAVYGEHVQAPCPGLKVGKDRYVCEVLSLVNDEQRAYLFFTMGIGAGCDSD
jgi:hypothetical protein